MGLDINSMSAVVGEVQRDYLYFITLEPIVDVNNVNESLKTSVLATLQKAYNSVKSVLNSNGIQLDMYNLKAIIPPRKTADITLNYAGQKKHYSGVDESSTSTQLEFLQDEANVIYNFFNQMQQLSGDESIHSAAYESMQNIQLSVVEVSVTKRTITLYKTLNKVKVLGVSASQPNKEGSGLGRVTVDIVWDTSTTKSDMIGRLF